MERVGWYYKNSGDKLHAVGEKEPNSFSLYDMHGSVWEWVEDDWHDNYDGAPDDGRAWTHNQSGSMRVVRGGGWGDAAWFSRSAYRVGSRPGGSYYFPGFRLLLLPGQQG